MNMSALHFSELLSKPKNCLVMDGSEGLFITDNIN
jgi:hypothetical protein